MKNVRERSIVAVGLIVALAGCAGGAGTSPAGAGTAGLLAVNAPPSVDGIAGFYEGTAKYGALKGTAQLQLAQSSSSAGGTMRMTFGTTALTSALALKVAAADTASGTAIVYHTKPPSAAPCSLNVTNVKYDPSTLMLTGKYAAFRGCSGASGSFRFTQKCYYVVATPRGADMRPRNTPRPC